MSVIYNISKEGRVGMGYGPPKKFDTASGHPKFRIYRHKIKYFSPFSSQVVKTKMAIQRNKEIIIGYHLLQWHCITKENPDI